MRMPRPLVGWVRPVPSPVCSLFTLCDGDFGSEYKKKKKKKRGTSGNWQIIWNWTVYFPTWYRRAGIGGMQNTAALKRGGVGLGALCNSALPSAQWVLGEMALTYLSIEFKWGTKREWSVARREDFERCTPAVGRALMMTSVVGRHGVRERDKSFSWSASKVS